MVVEGSELLDGRQLLYASGVFWSWNLCLKLSIVDDSVRV
jgi:hypothetical protein